MAQTVTASAQTLLEGLAAWVRMETPTTHPDMVNRLMDLAEADLTAAGAVVERHQGTGGFGDTLVARTPGRDAPDGRAGLIAGHLDTVWDPGTLAAMPFRVDGPRAYGPGIFDMKAGSYLALHVFCAVLRQGVPTARPLVLLLTPDEEVGSPTSRAHIEREAGGAAWALIPEPAGAGGACVTARKGVGRFVLRVTGRGAHAGNGFADGASAVVELAHQIQAVHALVDADRGITLNAAPVWGGTRPNVIPPDAGCEIDLRVASAADGEAMAAALRGLAARTPGCAVAVEGGMNRPPFAETVAGLGMYETARAVAAGLGMRLPKQSRGGGSDGNFTAALGVPTLDGLGCPGGGAHVASEHILWEALGPRAALLAGVIEALG